MRHHSPSWFTLSSEATAHICNDALVTAIVFTVCAYGMVLLRWYSRIVCRSGYVGWDDYLISVSMLLSICITGLIGGEYNLDSQHSDKGDRKASNLAIMLKAVFTQSLLYHLSIALIKTSFTLQCLHLFSLIRPVTICCYILLFCILCATTWGIFGVIFLCEPISAYWDVGIAGTCMNAEMHFFSTSVVGIVLDWAIWILPIPVVGKLNLPRKQKWGLMGVFGLGGVVCVVSVLRLVLVWHYAHEGEVTKSGTFVLTWSTIELNVAIICASLLVMKPLFARFMPSIVSEQPVSAREDARIWRALTGLSQLVDERGQARKEECERRDTAILMGSNEGRGIVGLGRAWDPRRGLRVKRRSWLL